MQTSDSAVLRAGSRQSAVGSRASLAALIAGDRVGALELFEIADREHTLFYRFRGDGVSFGLEWPYRTQPPTADDFKFIAGLLSSGCR